MAFYFLKAKNTDEFSASDAAKWLTDLRLHAPNTSRLKAKLKDSRDTVRGTHADSFRLHHSFVQGLEGKFPHLGERSQEVIDEGTILPKVLYQSTHGYIESLAAQINASYEHNIFDGCAVLMRRLTEVLLILSYEHLGIASAIKDGSGNYFLLEGITNNAKANGTLGLSRNSKSSIEDFMQLGNFSAHNITYTCKREYIRQVLNQYRALVEELLHKSGIRK